MNTIIVADIFGKTSALEELANAICKKPRIVDPYDGQKMAFQSENDAYQFFASNIGLEKYTKDLSKVLTKLALDVNLVGFSIGASVIWNLSESPASSFVKNATCFYGSQIRNNRKVSPTFPITLIFPETEEHFSVSELISDLCHTRRTKIRQVPYRHGFMNKLSANFNPKGYESELQTLATRSNRCAESPSCDIVRHRLQ
ncbi:dienelactone hydrolase family protein [Alteromonas oceanisediminis]|uniref:dienelactone hydrolase family protein n=1 Tax=Alteromonas oceanisediminis TaxID=2836180 RepID=UPI001BD98967|nr:dienelactone hydrolase family protein [Alteromonas oceanisediminis]MBT0586947.1 dienelactone hydrolase family protein [Alteromonas oceanisediminis]